MQDLYVTILIPSGMERIKPDLKITTGMKLWHFIFSQDMDAKYGNEICIELAEALAIGIQCGKTYDLRICAVQAHFHFRNNAISCN
jgi:hypothetical protein